MRVVVIGAGVVGAAVAAELAARGARVTVLEADHPGAGTTANSFAWINSANKEPEPYFALNHAGIRAHYALAGDGAPWFFPAGNLEWAVTDRHKEVLAARVARLTARGYPAEWITAERARELEPDLAAAPSHAVYAFFPEEAYTLPVLLLSRLLGAARDRGATVVGGARATAIERGTAGTTVVCADGGRHPADTVVSCAGRWTQEVARLAGAHVPMADPDLAGSATVGFLATTAPTAARLSRVLTGPRLNARPDGGGRLLLQALDLDATADPAKAYAPDGEIATAMLARLPEVLNGAEGTAVEKVRVGRRAMPGDGFTVAGFPATDVPFYVVATHSGITLAPLLGRLVADELYGDESPLLKDFRPSRFTSGAVLPPPPPARRPGEQ
ncbi:NAD(P)/FAD-dependent oxidoreductase [Streptomyces violaceusniger]|uniref:FAD-dependent oxidoreductase n=1 Tax=Streptomyces violaceusniger TaxID=68280 RepID=A0A4D4LNA0_STRVO|nr:FAD-dependent oxidoreductase [Streptomyces violaceusniger]